MNDEVLRIGRHDNHHDKIDINYRYAFSDLKACGVDGEQIFLVLLAVTRI